ncbi:hypothetical protein ACI6Q2_18000 [Chitinophagaceae bacterium LWZ2-11]
MAKHPHLLFILVCVTITTMFSCRKDSSASFVPYTNGLNDTTWSAFSTVKKAVSSSFLPELEHKPLVDSFDCGAGAQFIWGDSVQAILPPYAYYNNAGPITSGKIVVEVTVLVHAGDFIRYDKPTINYNYAALEAGAYVNIKLTKDGQDVSFVPGASYKIRVKDPGAKASLSYFAGYAFKYAVSGDSIFSWSPSYNGKALIWYDLQTSKKLGHEITSYNLRWFGSSQFADSTPPRTRVNVLLPLNFTNKNTEVFAVYQNNKVILSFLPSAPTRTFYIPGIVVNTNVTLVSISKINGSYYLGSKNVTITGPNGISLTPVKKSLQDISNFLNGL